MSRLDDARQAFQQKIFQISPTVNDGTDHHGLFSNAIHDEIGLDDQFARHLRLAVCLDPVDGGLGACE